MKQKCIYPKGVYSVQINHDKNNDYFLTGLTKHENFPDETKEWIFKLPSGYWCISEHNFEKKEIILWNGLEDIQDKFEYYTEEFSLFLINNLQKYLNQKLSEGSELVSVFEYTLIFKRKLI